MKKHILLIAILMITLGCASTMNSLQTEQYLYLYESALESQSNIALVMDPPVEQVMEITTGHLSEIGYDEVLYFDKEVNLYVYVKNIQFVESVMMGAAHAYRIIVKYTTLKDGKIQVDFVRGAQMVIVAGKVDQDIRELSKRMKGE